MPRKKIARRDGVSTPKDRPGFIIQWTDFEGRRKRRTVKGSSRDAAERALAAEKSRVEEARTFGRPLPSEDSFEAFAREFLKDQERRIKPYSAKGHITRAEFVRQKGIVEKHFIPHFGSMKLALIRKAHVIEFINKRMGEVSDGTIIKERNVLRRLFNVAIDKQKIAANPADGRSLREHMPAQPEGRVRWLEKEEWERVFRACYIPADKNGNEQRQWLQQAAGLALALGARRGELLNVNVPDVDLTRGFVALRRTKNGKARMVPINDLARMVLDAMSISDRKQKKDRGPLFGDVEPAQLSMKFIRACRNAEIEDFSFHDLRHCNASWLRMMGADLHDVQMLLGHSDPRMSARYAHLSQDHLAAASARLNGVFALPKPEVS